MQVNYSNGGTGPLEMELMYNNTDNKEQSWKLGLSQPGTPLSFQKGCALALSSGSCHRMLLTTELLRNL